MPIGNGRLGAMVFGDPLKERLQFNDITLWTGGANESGKYDIDDPGGFGSYQNFGDLFITMIGMEKYENYSRSLDLATEPPKPTGPQDHRTTGPQPSSSP
jgi:alpha-L-fucosidase 2